MNEDIRQIFRCMRLQIKKFNMSLLCLCLFMFGFVNTLPITTENGNSAPLLPKLDSNRIGLQSTIVQKQQQQSLPTFPSSNSHFTETTKMPPHCSRTIVTASQSSRLTRRSIQSAPQMSLNIGVGQTICFRLQDADELDKQKQINPQQQQQRFRSQLANKNRRALNPTLIEKDSSNKTQTDQQNNSTNFLKSANHSTNASDELNRLEESIGFNNDNNHLHTLTLMELEQYHAITERYRFAIPEVETNCICECNPLASTCQADEWKYGTCSVANEGNNKADDSNSQNTVCHRTFFPNQPSGACPYGSSASGNSNTDKSSSSSRLCCQLRFRPYQNRIFTAIRLEAATTYAILQYSVFNYGNANSQPNRTEWSELERRKIRVQLDGSIHNSILDSKTGLKLSILGLGGKSSSNQLEPGMYFVENYRNNEYGEIIAQSLNRITEHDFHKLGWFRIDENGNALVQSGDIFLDKIHHAKTNNCAEQSFRSVLEASYYVNREDNGAGMFQLAEPLSYNQRWIRSARLFDASLRQAVVKAGEGNNLEITLTIPFANSLPHVPASALSSASSLEEIMPSHRKHAQRSHHSHAPNLSITFVHNSSRLADFAGVILVDKFSNSLLNLSVYGARGVLNGYIRQWNNWNGEDIDTFSIRVPQPHYLLDQNEVQLSQDGEDLITVIERIKPYPVNSIQVVCLRPDDADSTQELCRMVQSVEFDLEMNTVRNEWHNRVGSCDDCNRITVDGFMKYLNPMNWTKGINSISEALMLVSDVVVYLFAILLLYCLITKVIIPIATCCLCPMQVFYSRTKK